MAKILLMEDDESFREFASAALLSSGHEVVTAQDGREGLRQFKAQTFELIITDIVMPEREGLEVLMEVRKENPTQKIIAMSGNHLDNRDLYLSLAGRLGANALISKPIEIGDFLKAVDGVLSS